VIAAQLPHHRQWLPAGMQFTAELMAPLEFSKAEPAEPAPNALAELTNPTTVIKICIWLGPFNRYVHPPMAMRLFIPPARVVAHLPRRERLGLVAIND
jgi:hypothetical protein